MLHFLKNYLSTCLFIVIAAVIYGNSNFHMNIFAWELRLNFIEDFSIKKTTILYGVYYLYFILLIPYYIFYNNIESKARIVIGYLKKVIVWDNSQSEIERTALLAWIVKIFFAPLMITWLSEHIFNMLNNLHSSYLGISLFSTDFLVFFNSNFFWTAFSLILFIDVLFFTLWYLLEAPFLKNTIRSVEPTIIGWAACIFCYPPFNSQVGKFIDWFSNDFPNFANMYVHIWMNLTILVLMGIYSRASFSLGFKASNLTNRGIVGHGPYKYIRHPAYICKNLAWLVGGIPMIYIALTQESLSIFTVLIGLGWWAGIYYLRSITEENHLSRDPDYVAYKKQVPYKFIPKVW